MKKILCCILALMLLTMGLAMAEENTPLMGGWTICTPEEGALTEETQAVFDKAMEGFVGSNVTPIALLGKQLVNGTNYCFLCYVEPVTPNPAGNWKLVYIYEPLTGDVELTAFEDLVLEIPEEGE